MLETIFMIYVMNTLQEGEKLRAIRSFMCAFARPPLRTALSTLLSASSAGKEDVIFFPNGDEDDDEDDNEDDYEGMTTHITSYAALLVE